jgi:hypothetical protein
LQQQQQHVLLLSADLLHCLPRACSTALDKHLPHTKRTLT